MDPHVAKNQPTVAPARIRWKLWLTTLAGATVLPVVMIRNGSAVDTAITWVILGGLAGGIFGTVIERFTGGATESSPETLPKQETSTAPPEKVSSP